ncbi:MAG: type VI secretion system baseplate subunit TssF [Ancalomicrobiaceae bacterium]|nr:type VI secretion system baseplate subunit TssF [Ancalomicrobiaceae bacterium]
MDREFLDLYDAELKLLREQAKEFAEEYPGIADRLGGLIEDRIDPMIQGVLEGAAFLAARVQLKLRHEFPEFTANLLEQLIPNFLSPTPSALIVQAIAPFGEPALKEGRKIPRGSYLDATYIERDRRIACRYRLTGDITLWPFEIRSAGYHGATAQLQALGIQADERVRAGLRIAMTTRMATRPDAEVADADAKPEHFAANVRADELTFFLTGQESDAIALYEQIFAHRAKIYVRYLDSFGDPVFFEMPVDAITQIGFEEADTLVPTDARIFHGFALLKDYFHFARKYLGFRISGLSKALPRIKAKAFELVIGFSESNPRLQAIITAEHVALYAAPAINLFEKTADRIPVKSQQYEYHVVADRSRPLDFEPHRVIDVFAHFPGRSEKVPVLPLYSAPRNPNEAAAKHFYTIRRLPRRRTSMERRFGAASDYTGTEMFMSLIEPAGIGDEQQIAELSVKALCSNRHLTDALPVGESGADFRLLDDAKLDFRCIAGPTRPKEPVASHLRTRGETASTGSVTWRLINMLALNHLGLISRGAGRNAQSLREMLSLFADLRDAAIERRIDGIRTLDSKPVVRRVRRSTGMGAARGLEITVLVDEKAFEGSGAFLLGAVLDRLFAEYVALNNFTQTVIRSVERGEIMRWPVRLGHRRPL